MNLFDSAFLCLDIGTSSVRGIAHRVRNAKIDKSAISSVDSFDTVFAIKSVIDELENKIGTHFDAAYITGNFGAPWFTMTAKSTVWNGEHKITPSDIRDQISQIAPPPNYYPMHIIPLRYDTPSARNMVSPIGHTDRQLISAFSGIFFARANLDEISMYLRRAHIQSAGFFDAHFLHNHAFRIRQVPAMFIDFGANITNVSIWTDRGPVCRMAFAHGGTEITRSVSDKLKLDFESAEKIKRNVASMIPSQMDRFTPADTAYDFSRADVNEIVAPQIADIIGEIKGGVSGAFDKYKVARIFVSGGGAEIDGVIDYIENTFGVQTENIHRDASVRALSKYIWDTEEPKRNAYIARSERMSRRLDKITSLFRRNKRRPNKQFIPIMPSTLCFDMASDLTYSMFKSAAVSMIHVDIMDGLYVNRIAGSMDQIKHIRTRTNGHLHVHLMTESPAVVATDAIAAGADTVIVSTNTSGVRVAIRNIHAAGRRAGIALAPESSVTILKPILREIDEVMVMAVAPGAAGQNFNPECLHKIAILNATRKKYGLKFTISVDGGINDKTAKLCWDAGADTLVSGSFLSHADDFTMAVQSLLKQSD